MPTFFDDHRSLLSERIGKTSGPEPVTFYASSGGVEATTRWGMVISTSSLKQVEARSWSAVPTRPNSPPEIAGALETFCDDPSTWTLARNSGQAGTGRVCA
jgi:hypothetical protein